MFILSRADVRRLGGDLALNPADIGKYFWVQASAAKPQDSQVLRSDRPRWREPHMLRADWALKSLVKLFAAKFEGKGTYSDESSFRETSSTHFDQDANRVEKIEIRQMLRLSASLLLWPEQLKEFGIEATPGYLYMLVPPSPDGRLGPSDVSHLEWEWEPTVDVSWDSKTKHLELCLSAMPRGSIRDVELVFNATELPTNRTPEPKFVLDLSRTGAGSLEGALEYARGIIDSRTRRVGCNFRVDPYPRVVMTPFEFPPGLVMETASFLRIRRGLRDTAFVKSFVDLAFSKKTLQRAQCFATTSTDKPIIFPRGEALLNGSDVAWRYSDNPWMVQLVLFARLLGGSYLNRVLGTLALGFGKECIDWSSPLFKPNSDRPNSVARGDDATAESTSPRRISRKRRRIMQS